MSKKRILIVGQHFWPESFRINDIADYLAHDKNLEVDVLCGLPNYPKGVVFSGYSILKNRKQKHNDITIYRALEIPRGNNSNLRVFLNYISFPFFSLFHIPHLLTKKYDKIFIYQLSPVMMSIAGIILGKLKRIETTMYVLDLWPENLYSVLDIKNSILRKIAASVSHWHYRNVDKLVALSEAMRQKLVAVANISDEKIIVLPQAAEKLYEESMHDMDLEMRFKDTFNLVFAGNISPAQSFPTMIDAAGILKNRGLEDIRWIIVGDGMSKAVVEHEVNKRGLSDIFVFEGQKPIEDMPKYSSIADSLIGCLVRSSLLEATIPAKVMSYIASGKPLLLAMDGEVQNLINKEIRCGYVCETENAEALADNIQKVYSLSDEAREILGENASRYHKKHFERSIILDKLYRFIFEPTNSATPKV